MIFRQTRIQAKISLTTILLLLSSMSFLLNGQEDKSPSVIKIDSTLNARLSENQNVDTINSLDGEAYFSTKILGIRIRTGRGEYFRIKLLYKKDLIVSQEAWFKGKKRNNSFYIIQYFYIDNRFVKYRNIEYTEDKNSQNRLIKHEYTLYFTNDSIIHYDIVKHDNFKTKSIKMETVIKHSLENLDDVRRFQEEVNNLNSKDLNKK